MSAALVVIGIVVIVALGIYFGWYAKKKRREELARMAAQLGLQYSQQDTFNLLGLPFGLFRMGDGRGCENVMWGRWLDIQLQEFDYWYYEESTDSKGNRTRTYYRFSCVVSQLPLDSAHLSITKENLFTRLADHLGFEDISFESEEFNRKFQIKSKDRKFATDLIDARMMQWLLATEKGWSYELSGPYLLCYHKRLRPVELTPLLGTMKEFRDHIPRVVYGLYGSGASGGSSFTA
jgi:type II secretory pathway pseudopilin PulG